VFWITLLCRQLPLGKLLVDNYSFCGGICVHGLHIELLSSMAWPSSKQTMKLLFPMFCFHKLVVTICSLVKP
jgi:hypothetical protein